MQVTWSLNGADHRPLPSEMAWQYALSLVWAHAHASKVQRLVCISPWTPIIGLIPREEDECSDMGGPFREALAFFGSQPEWPGQASIVYTFATREGRALRPPDSWRIRERYYLYTHASKVFGIVMRIGAWLRRPGMEDWGVCGVRRHYLSTTPRLASYRLSIWMPRKEDSL